MKKNSGRPKVIIDDCDINIINYLNQKQPYSIMELVKKVNFAHGNFRKHLIKLEEWKIIKLTPKKGRRIDITLVDSKKTEYILKFLKEFEMI
jgi:predicted transcriptional regulator